MADNIQLKVQYSDGGALTSLTKINEMAMHLGDKKISIKVDVSGLKELTNGETRALNSIVRVADAITKRTNAEAKLEAAHSKTANAAARQTEAEAKLEAAHSKTANAAARQTEAEAKLEAAHSKTANAAARQTEAEAKLEAAHSKTANAAARQTEAEAKLEAAHSKTANAAARQTEAEAKLETAQARKITATAKGNEVGAKYITANAKRVEADAKMVASQAKMREANVKTVKALNDVTESANKAGDSLLENAKKFATWMLLGNAISGVKRAFEEALDEMKAADSELVTVRKVTGMTADELERLNEAAFATATKYGESASEYLANVAEFARAGYGDTADELAELSVKTQIVGDTTADTANQFLLAVDAAYKYNGSITALSRVLDGANEIDNKYATSIEKIAGGLGIVAPVAAQANIGIDELTAAIGTITAVTQRSGTEAATALRAIILNIVGDTKTEIEDGATWTAGQIEGLSDIIKIYAKDAYDAAQASGEVLNPMKAIAGLAQSVKDGVLSASQLYEMVSDIGGKLRASQLTALVQNWDMYESMLTDYASAYGSAEKEIENATDSWERKTKQLQNTWTEFIQKSINTSSIKGLIDIAKWIVTFENNLGSAALKWTAFAVALNSGKVYDVFTRLISKGGQFFQTLNGGFALLRGNLEKSNVYQQTFNQLLTQEAIIQGKMTDEIDANTRAQIANTAAKKAAASAIISWVGLAVTAAATVYQIYSYFEAKAAQTRQQIIENSKATAEQVENLTELIQQYETLSKERKDGGAWDNTQISQAKSLQEQITSLVGDQAKQLDLVNGGYEEQIAKLKEIYAIQAKTGIMDASDAEKAALKNVRKSAYSWWEGEPEFHSANEDYTDAIFMPMVNDIESWKKDYKYLSLDRDIYGIYTINTSTLKNATAEEALEYYKELEDLRAKLFENYKGTNAYETVSELIAKYKDDFEELETAVKTKQTYQDILKAAETGDWSKVFLSDNDTGGGSSGGSGGTTASADDVKKLYEELEKAVNKRLEARKKEIDAMKEAYDLEKDTLDLAEKRLKVEEAEKALRSAESERTIRVYNAATGQWEWQADESAIEKAKDNLKDAEDALNDAEWQQEYNRQLREYEAEKAKYDEIFDTVDDITDSVRDIDTILADIADKQLPEFSAAFDKVKEVFGDAVKVTDTGSTNTGSTTGGSSAGGGNAFKKATEIIASKAKAETADEGTARVSDEVVTRLANAGKVPSFDFGQAAVSRADKNTQTFSSVTTNNKTTNNTSSFDRYYYINGFKVGNDAADRPLSEILGVLSIYKERD